MPSYISISVYPKFEPEKILTKLINVNFLAAEKAVVEAASTIVEYMQNYIYQHSKRSGQTGTLAKAIDFYPETQMTGSKKLSFECGIGKISELPKYWKIINFGGFSAAAMMGTGVPGSFNGNPPEAGKAGTGIGNERWGNGKFVMFPKNEIAGKHYIEAAKVRLNNELRKNIQEALALASKSKGVI